jgi:hypothetical protein
MGYEHGHVVKSRHTYEKDAFLLGGCDRDEAELEECSIGSDWDVDCPLHSIGCSYCAAGEEVGFEVHCKIPRVETPGPSCDEEEEPPHYCTWVTAFSPPGDAECDTGDACPECSADEKLCSQYCDECGSCEGFELVSATTSGSDAHSTTTCVMRKDIILVPEDASNFSIARPGAECDVPNRPGSPANEDEQKQLDVFLSYVTGEAGECRYPTPGFCGSTSEIVGYTNKIWPDGKEQVETFADCAAQAREGGFTYYAFCAPGTCPWLVNALGGANCWLYTTCTQSSIHHTSGQVYMGAFSLCNTVLKQWG